LVAERDTLIARAEAVLREFPQGSVRYNPAKHGWRHRSRCRRRLWF
jgi:hypothetical protein